MEIERRDFAFEEENELIVESRADGRAAIIGYAAVYNRLSLDLDRKSTRLNSSHVSESRMPSSA